MKSVDDAWDGMERDAPHKRHVYIHISNQYALRQLLVFGLNPPDQSCQLSVHFLVAGLCLLSFCECVFVFDEFF